MGLVEEAEAAVGTVVNPYLLWIKIGVAVLAVSAIIGGCVYVRSVFHERDTLLVEKAAIQKQLKDTQDSIIADKKLQEGIANAVKNIRVVSNNYIQSVEDAPPPVVVDGGTIVLVPAGVPQAVPALRVFANVSSNGNSPVAPPGGTHQAVEQVPGVAEPLATDRPK